MQLSRRTYYHRPKAPACDQPLLDRIEQICLEYPRYGYRRVTHQLKREGWTINHKKVSRIMREHNWVCRRRTRNWIATTDTVLRCFTMTMATPISAGRCRSNRV